MTGAMRPLWLVSLFLLLMAPIGFALGTLVLLGPVRWVTGALRARNAPSSLESAAVIGIIVALVLCTAGIAWLLFTSMQRGSTVGRVVIPAVAIALAGGAWLLWLDTNLMSAVGGGGTATRVSAGFTFGPYPDESALVQLKAQGYDGVITLLHPAVVPFEPQLLEREKKAAARAGIPLIHLPMLPWISGNEDSVDRLTQLASEGSGKYYVHCYLGKDRVLIARRIVEQHAPNTVQLDGNDRRRSIDHLPAFERGSLLRLSERVTLGPFPTDEEFASYILNGTFDNVVTLLNPAEPEALQRIQQERSWLSRVGVEFVELPLSPATPERALEVARAVNQLEGRTYVHAFFSVDSDRSRTPALFADAFRQMSASAASE